MCDSPSMCGVPRQFHAEQWMYAAQKAFARNLANLVVYIHFSLQVFDSSRHFSDPEVNAYIGGYEEGPIKFPDHIHVRSSLAIQQPVLQVATVKKFLSRSIPYLNLCSTVKRICFLTVQTVISLSLNVWIAIFLLVHGRPPNTVQRSIFIVASA